MSMIRWMDGQPLGRTSSRADVFLFLVAITGVAALLRFYHLGMWSFWIDEIFTLQTAQALGQNLRERPLFALTEFPLTAALIALSVRLVGVSEWSARLGPALVGTLSPLLLFWPLKRMAGERVALIVALLMAVAPWHVHWSQNGRFYIVMLLTYSLALIFFFLALETNRLRMLLAALLMLALATTERLLALTFVPVAAVYIGMVLLLPSVKRPSGLNRQNLIVLALTTTIVGLVGGWLFITNPALWRDIYFVDVDRGPLDILMQHVSKIDATIIVMGLVGGVTGLRQPERRRSTLFLLVSAILPLLLTMVLALFQFTHVRYTFLTLVSWLALAAIAIEQLWQAVTGSWSRLIALALLFSLFVLMPFQELFDYYAYQHGGRSDWKTAFATVVAQQQPGDLFFSNDPTVGSFYTGNAWLEMREVDKRLTAVDVCNGRIWVVLGGDSRINPQMKQAARQYGRQMPATAHDMQIYLISAQNPALPDDKTCAGNE